MSLIRSTHLFVLVALLVTPAVYAGDGKGNAASGKELFVASACSTCHGVTRVSTSTPAQASSAPVKIALCRPMRSTRLSVR